MSKSSKAGDERRTIEELYTRYDLEPELADIYVEGPSDAAFIEWFLHHNGRRCWQVYPVESVNVPSELIAERGFDEGARGRVLTLAITLEERLKDSPAIKPLFIADLDFDAISINVDWSCDLCLLTDFTSLDLYCYNPKTLDKYLRVVLQTGEVNANEVLDGMTPALRALFLVRAVLHIGRTGVKLIDDVTRCCEATGGQVNLDLEDLIRRSLNASPIRPQPDIGEILRKVENLQGSLPSDARLAIRGHDFVRILAWFLRPYARLQAYRQADVVGRALRGCLEAEDLIQHPMFKELLRRTAILADRV